MNVKRILSGVFGLPIVILVLVLGNKYVIDVILAIVAMVSIHEYMNCVGNKVKPVKWIGYVFAALIALIHIIPIGSFGKYIGLDVTIIMVLLFLIVIFSELKTNIVDVSVTLFGVIYIVGFISYISILYGLDEVGKYFIWYIFMASWGSDVLAYCIGKSFGKHKFSKISPNKSIEGCIAGAVGGTALVLAYTVALNMIFGMQIDYVIIGFIGLILSILGQIGDFSASSIKRYAGVKDFSNLIPGHGGMIDRIDSVIFIAPFTYYLLKIFIM